MKELKLAIVMEGGLVTGVCTDDPVLEGVEVIRIDYDANDEEAVMVPQGNGDDEPAWVDSLTVELIGPKGVSLKALRDHLHGICDLKPIDIG